MIKKYLQYYASIDTIDSVQHRTNHLRIIVNGISFNEVLIDTHYELKHKASINDEIILGLVQGLDKGTFLPEKISPSGHKFFVNEPWPYKGKWYRLVWFIPQDESYLGIRNAFRSRQKPGHRSKHG